MSESILWVSFESLYYPFHVLDNLRNNRVNKRLSVIYIYERNRNPDGSFYEQI